MSATPSTRGRRKGSGVQHKRLSSPLQVSPVDLSRLDASFAGRMWDAEFLADLPEGVDPCGENGEFHTCVLDGPAFAAPLSVTVGETVVRDGFAYADLLPV